MHPDMRKHKKLPNLTRQKVDKETIKKVDKETNFWLIEIPTIFSKTNFFTLLAFTQLVEHLFHSFIILCDN